MVTPAQCRAARQLLGWSSRRLAEEAKVAPATLLAFETEKKETRPRTIDAIQATLERAGVEFVPPANDTICEPNEIRFTDGSIVRLRTGRP